MMLSFHLEDEVHELPACIKQAVVLNNPADPASAIAAASGKKSLFWIGINLNFPPKLFSYIQALTFYKVK